MQQFSPLSPLISSRSQELLVPGSLLVASTDYNSYGTAMVGDSPDLSDRRLISLSSLGTCLVLDAKERWAPTNMHLHKPTRTHFVVISVVANGKVSHILLSCMNSRVCVEKYFMPVPASTAMGLM